MTDPFVLATTVLAHNLHKIDPSRPIPSITRYKATISEQQIVCQMAFPLQVNICPDSSAKSVEFSQPFRVSPRSGGQLFRQRLAALRAGQLYTRLPTDSFRASWMRTGKQPTYKQWRKLLAREATVVAAGQGDNQLNILLGDSLSLWFPSDRLPQHQFWLNQSLSGDTTSDILRRLSAFAKTRPHVIYLMAGINDLKHGASDDQILGNLRRIINQLQLTHPQARIVLQSILPTRSMRFSNERIGQLNQQLEAIAEQNNISYLDLYSKMMDFEGNLHPALTTDGLHLNAKGYETWQWALLQTESQIAAREQG